MKFIDALLLGGIALNIIGCTTLSNSFLLHPSHHPIEHHHSLISIPTTHPKLQHRSLTLLHSEFGDTSPSATVVPVLVLSGSEKRAELMAGKTVTFFDHLDDSSPLLHAGTRYVLWTLQYPGWGTDTKEPSLELLVPAALEALSYVETQHPGQKPIVMGFSLGSAVALSLADQEEARIRGLVLEKIPDLRAIIWDHYGWWNLWLLAGLVVQGIPSEIHAHNNARGTAIPALFCLAPDDKDVPFTTAKPVYDVYAGPKKILLSSGGHQDPLSETTTPGLQEGWLWLLATSLNHRS